LHSQEEQERRRGGGRRTEQEEKRTGEKELKRMRRGQKTKLKGFADLAALKRLDKLRPDDTRRITPHACATPGAHTRVRARERESWCVRERARRFGFRGYGGSGSRVQASFQPRMGGSLHPRATPDEHTFRVANFGVEFEGFPHSRKQKKILKLHGTLRPPHCSRRAHKSERVSRSGSRCRVSGFDFGFWVSVSGFQVSCETQNGMGQATRRVECVCSGREDDLIRGAFVAV